MTKGCSEQSEQDWVAAFDTILMLGNVDMFYCPDLIYSDDLYNYVVTKVRRRIHYIKSRLDERSKVNATLDIMLEMCVNFQASLYNARYPESQGEEIEPSEYELDELAAAFRKKMTRPITELVEAYELHPNNRYFTELMVRPTGRTTLYEYIN